MEGRRSIVIGPGPVLILEIVGVGPAVYAGDLVRGHRIESNPGVPEISTVPAPELDEETLLKQTLGFTSFDSTKGKKVPSNVRGLSSVHKKRKYRQYMNRRGGFNRPLDPIA
ncbi:unnamed protein product [Soboliphyme baturini]|uniref:U4/U6.U5 small nuclear ribonucleoprotein 27 kDa protein n=1 Tax=Soboliphyme baturini TaxID=241478 RepID=A0A183J082_9BILA|nr:unnamed protein product [Soboliphyme baturini]